MSGKHAAIPNRFDTADERALIELVRRKPMPEWDAWPPLCEKIEAYVKNGARYAVALDASRRRVFERGTIPDGLRLDFDAIFDA